MNETQIETPVRSAPAGARALARAELTRRLLTEARVQLAEVGPAALSVRAVARELGMASSAVYRYFPSRDALLTALVIAAYDEVGAAVERAEAAVADRADHAARFRATADALRVWSLAHPHDYALIYGSPVPGYAAPDDTIASATRVTRIVLMVLQDAQDAGRAPVGGVAVTPAERAAVEPLRSFTEPGLDDPWIVRGLVAWAALFGGLSLELFGHLYRGVLDYDAHFAQVLDQLVADLGLAR